MLSTMNSNSDGDTKPSCGSSIGTSKYEPPDLDYEGPSVCEDRHQRSETNGNDNGNIPDLVVNNSPTRNRRKRRKGIPTRVAPTIVHKDELQYSSDEDPIPPFLLPNSPARMPLMDSHSATPPATVDGGQSPMHPHTPPPANLYASPSSKPSKTPVQTTPVSYVSASSANNNSSNAASPKSRPVPRRRSSTNRSKQTQSASNKMVIPADSLPAHPAHSEDMRGMVFGYTKVTSNITTTSRGAKRVKLIVYMCNFCNFKTADNAAFWEHSVQHLFTCPHCPFKAFTRQSLVSHMEKEHPGQVPEEYINICEISVIEMCVTRNITSDPPPPGKGARLDTSPFSSPAHDEALNVSTNETPPPRLVNQKNYSKNKELASGKGQKNATPPTDLKFRCDFCMYITSSFTAFMTHQKEHTADMETIGITTSNSKRAAAAAATAAASSGKLKSLLVGRITPPPHPVSNNRDNSPSPAGAGRNHHHHAMGPKSKTKGGSSNSMLSATPVLKVPQVIKTKASSDSLLHHQEATNLSMTAGRDSPSSILHSELSKHSSNGGKRGRHSLEPAAQQSLLHGELSKGKSSPAGGGSCGSNSSSSGVGTTTTDGGSTLTNDSLLHSELSKHAKCPICNFVLRSLAELEAHIHLCHQSRLTVSGSTTTESCRGGSSNDNDYTWCCIYCTAKSDTKLGVVTHIKAHHPGEKIRVWRWANKGTNATGALSPNDNNNSSGGKDSTHSPPPPNSKKVANTTPDSSSSSSSKKASKDGDPEDPNSLILKQIVSSTIDNVYGAAFGEVQSTPLSLTKTQQSVLKIPEVTNTTDIMEGKCAITVRKVTPNSSSSGQARPMRSLITGGLVTSPAKPIGSQLTVSPPIRSGEGTGKANKSSRQSSEKIPDQHLQPPLMTASYLGMDSGSDLLPDGLMDLSLKKPRLTDDTNKSEVVKLEPMSPASDLSQDDLRSLMMREGEDLGDFNSLDVDVEVRAESLVPTDHISYNEDERLHCCRHCSYQSRSYGHIVDHISTHTGMKTWSCSYCSYRSNRRHDLLRHLHKTHPGSRLKMIRNVPYSSKFNCPVKMSQRVSNARKMVAKKKTGGKRALYKQVTSQNLLRKSLAGLKGSQSPTKSSSTSTSSSHSPTKQKSPTKSDKWQPPPTVEFWECPICFRRGSMDVMEKHIPTVHPEKIRKRISKKEILEPSDENLIMSAQFTDHRQLRVRMVPLERMPWVHQDMGTDLPLFNAIQDKLKQMPAIIEKYNKVEGVDDALLGRELEEQREIELKEEVDWLNSLDTDEVSDTELSTVDVGIDDEEYRCQYCMRTDKCLYNIRKHLLWNHPDLLLKCLDMRAKPPLSPRVIHMCHRCTFHSVSPYSLLSHYSRNPKHSPGYEEPENNNSSSDEERPNLERAEKESESSTDDSLPALEKKGESEKRPVNVKFLTRPLGGKLRSRQVALKRVTKSCKNTLRFMQGTQLQCRYCKEFKVYDSTIMKDHLLTEHCGQPAIAIDVRSRELRRTSRVFFCPILECNFTEYGPDALVKHLNKAHPDTAFDALIIQICPKEKQHHQQLQQQHHSATTSSSAASKEVANAHNMSGVLSSRNQRPTPQTPPLPATPPRAKSSKKDGGSHGKGRKGKSKGGDKDKKPVAPVTEEDGLLRGGTMPKTSAELTMEKRYWCAYCDAHSATIEKVKSHFLENHMEQKATLIDARARVLRKKSRVYFCWNVTCNFTTFLENQATLHEQSQSCLNNFAPDDYENNSSSGGTSGAAGGATTGGGKVGNSSPTRTPEHSGSRTPEPSGSTSASSGGSRMFQCLYCSLMTSSRVNMLSHMAAEHACTSGGYSEINTEFNKDGDIIMNVGGDGAS